MVMQKVLFIQTAFIGDVVLATALLEKWHQHFPKDAIDILVRQGNQSLFNEHPFLNSVLVWKKKENKYKHLFELLQQIRQTKYDVVINCQRFAATGFLAAFSTAKIIVGFNKNPFSFLFTERIQHIVQTKNSKPLHEVERNNTLIQAYTDNQFTTPKLYPSSTDTASVQVYQSLPYYCIAPASVWFTKQFPKHKWVALINSLPKNKKVYLLGGNDDAELCLSIIDESLNTNVISLAGKLSFLQSAALQKNAVMNFVNDSAPMHFASAVNAATTAIYCSTIPAFGFGPLSTKHYVVESTIALACRPCGLHGRKKCPLQHFNCANNINIRQFTID